MTLADVFGVDLAKYGPELFHGAARALAFTVVSFALASVLGLVVAVARSAPSPLVRAPGLVYTEVIKNLPILTGIFITYFGLATVGLTLSAFQAGCASLAIFYGAYLAEIFRGSLLSVTRGQREAAQAAGLSGTATMRFVVLPQALRVALPGTGTMLVDLLKATSLLVTIGGAELMTVGQNIASVTFAPLGIYTLIGLIYFVMCFPLSRAVAFLERLLERGVPLMPQRRRLHREIRRQIPDAVLVSRSR
jgi:polar amino acid transport system permease protein